MVPSTGGPEGVDILVVDADPGAATALAGILGASGFGARAAGSPDEALRLATDRPPDAVVFDLGLLAAGGHAAALALARSARVPLMIGIARSGPDEHRGTPESVFHTVTGRPLNLPLLLATLRQLVRFRSPR